MSASTNGTGDQAPDKSGSEKSSAVGYKRPPARTRFPKGKSGNPKGRPKGQPSVANVIRDILNEPVSVRAGEKSRNMPSIEAMVRVQVNNTCQGDKRALTAFMDVLEMTGRTKEMTDEERQKRALHLPRPLPLEHLDFFYSAARELERQRYLAQAEYEEVHSTGSNAGVPAPTIPPAIKAGDELAAQGKLVEALAAYRALLMICKTQLELGGNNKQTQKDFTHTVSRIGVMADKLLMAGQFADAEKCVRDVMSVITDPVWVRIADEAKKHESWHTPRPTDPAWLLVIRAQACMFLGDAEGARSYFLRFQSNIRFSYSSWETIILQDFERLRKAGHSHPLMQEIEKRYAEAGWTTKGKSPKSLASVMKSEDSTFIILHPDEIKSGDLLAEHGRMDDATASFRRKIEKLKAKLAKEPNNPELKEELQVANGRLGQMARKFLLAGRFGMALECAEDAIKLDPNNLMLHAVSVQAMMFVGRNDEARIIFLQHRGKKIGEKSWESVILEDFKEHRKAYRSRPLMEEIEQLFGIVEAKTHYSSNDLATAEKHGASLSALIQSSDITAGDTLADQGNIEEALAVYRRCLATCNAKIAKIVKGQSNIRAIDDRTMIIEKITGLAGRCLMNGDFSTARDAISSALAATPNAPILNVYLAHALMFLGDADEAKTLYLRYRRDKIDAQRCAESVILEDFRLMRNAGLTHPLMDEIKELFGVAGEEFKNILIAPDIATTGKANGEYQ
jgi:tetratricopeptide (TPR) repeat protein